MEAAFQTGCLISQLSKCSNPLAGALKELIRAYTKTPLNDNMTLNQRLCHPDFEYTNCPSGGSPSLAKNKPLVRILEIGV
jgi:hypothetical protein